ncbi:MAG: RpoL/Rpb11 RNA polymerase subunit family protein [Nitrososphaeraceae archaeon]
MLVEIQKSKEHELELKIAEEDISILHIVQHELLKEPDIDFAGVILRHQLMKEYLFRIVSRTGDPYDSLGRSIKSSLENSKNLLELVCSEFGKEEKISV